MSGYDQVTLLLLNSLWVICCAAQSLCFQCSDPNIEVHYGAFFDNPRVLQDENGPTGAELRCDSRKNARIRICRDPCYTLNVTTQDIRTGRLLPFGLSHGCSTLILSQNRIRARGCHRSEILLRTTPAHPLRAEYCFCTGDACNVIQPAYAMIRTAGPRFTAQDSKLAGRDQGLTWVTASAAENLHLAGTLVLLFLLLRCWCYVLSLCSGYPS